MTRRTGKLDLQVIALILAGIFVTACASVPVPTLSPPAVRPTNPSSIISPTTMQLTPTALAVASPGTQPTYAEAGMPTNDPAVSGTRIQVTIGETILTGHLWDNATARDLIDQLPLTLTFSDFNSLEKIASLPRKLSTEGMPAGDDPLPHDIGYYAPWGNLVFYYGDVGYFNGIVRIGQFDESMEAITAQTGDFPARIELTR